MKKIAVVDDNEDNSLLIKLILEDKYDVKIYENGPDALDGFHNDTPDLVLMDISLPGMDGIEILKKMKAENQLKYIPIIALTAHTLKSELENYIASGFDNYVAKPILDEEVLLQAISDLIKP